MAPRPRRRGTIVPPTGKRATFLARLDLGRDPARPGKRVRVNRSFRTKKEAEQWLTAQLAGHDTGAAPDPKPAASPRLGEWLLEWEEVHSRQLAPRTREEILAGFRRYLSPELRATPLNALTATAVQRVLNNMTDRGLSPRTVRKFYAELRARLEDAVEHGILPHQPLGRRRIRLPREKPKARRILTAEETAAFLRLAETDRYAWLWQFLAITGARPGEALALTWADLDPSEGSVSLRLGLSRPRSGPVIGPTKSCRPRTLHLGAPGRELLGAMRRRRAEAKLAGNQDALVFATPGGEPLDWGRVYRQHFLPLVGRLALESVGADPNPPARGRGTAAAQRDYRARRAAALALTGLDQLRAYDIRHTLLTRVIEGTGHLKLAQEVGGHASAVLTLSTYAQVRPGLAAETLSNLASAVLPSRRVG